MQKLQKFEQIEQTSISNEEQFEQSQQSSRTRHRVQLDDSIDINEVNKNKNISTIHIVLGLIGLIVIVSMGYVAFQFVNGKNIILNKQNQLLINIENKKIIVFFYNQRDDQQLSETLDQFQIYNSYQINQTYIISNQQPSKKMKDNYCNIQWIYNNKINNNGIFNIREIIRILKDSESDYFFFADDNWQFIKEGFIEESILQLLRNPQFSQISLRKDQYQSHIKQMGFSFKPALHRSKDFVSLLKSKIQLLQSSKNFTQLQQNISQIYSKNGFTINTNTNSLPYIQRKVQYKISSTINEDQTIQFKSIEQYNKILQKYKARFAKYLIKFDSIEPIYKKQPYYRKQSGNYYLPATQFDLGIKHREQFKLLKNQWEGLLPYQQYKFEFDPSLQYSEQKINLSGSFKTQEELQKYINNEGKKYHFRETHIQFDLSVLLRSKPKDPFVREAQYLYSDSKYGIGSMNQQSPICIFSSGHNTASDHQIYQSLQYIQNQNYSNYRLIIVDDFSTDSSFETYINYFQKSKTKLRNRVILIRNLERLRSSGNLYVRARQYCKENQIVVNVDSDDQLIGYQALKIINSVYRNPWVWMMYTNFQQQTNRKWVPGFTTDFTMNSQFYRIKQNVWITSHLKTWRQAIFKNAPMQYFIEYFHNQTSGYLTPKFIDEASNRLLLYYLIEVAGNSRIWHIPAIIYNYNYNINRKSEECLNIFLNLQQYKSRAMTPLKKLKQINDIPQPLQNYSCPSQIVSKLQLYQKDLQMCKKKIFSLKHEYYVVVTNSNKNQQSQQYTFNKFKNVLESLKSQTFQNWYCFYVVNLSDEQIQIRKEYLKNYNFQNKVTIIKGYAQLGKNYYEAINNRSPMQAVAILLDQSQIFASETSLLKIKKHFQLNNNAYILASGININGTEFSASSRIIGFKRHMFETKAAQLQIYRNISLHVRAFTVDFFRDIYPFDLVDLQDQFFNNKIAFLFPLLQMYTECPYCVRRNSNIFRGVALPTQILLVSDILFNSTFSLPEWNLEVQYIFFKATYEKLRQKTTVMRKSSNGHPQFWGQDIQPGKYNLLLKNVSKNVTRIPKNVHQFWISKNQLPPLKRKLAQIVKQKYEGYVYRLWTWDNITKQNFPRTYDIMMKLIQFDKISNFSRMSMVADLMRLEVLLNYGGFHVDLNYQVFKNYDQFRHYPLVVGVELQSFIPNVVSLGTFGAQIGCEYIDRVLTPKYLNAIKLGGSANYETGPHFLGKVTTMQDVYYKIKYIPSQVYLPYMPWSVDPRFHKCKCRFNGTVPQNLNGTYVSTEIIKNQITIIPCEKQYSDWNYGLDHFYFGASWRAKTT